MQIISVYSFLPLLSSFAIFALGLFVWLKKPKDWLVILFFLYDITNAIWLIGTFFLFNSLTTQEAVMWDRFIYTGVVFMPIFLYHFGFLYCDRVKKNKWKTFLLMVGYLASLIFLFLSQTSDNFVSGLYHYTWGVHTVAHIYHHIFLFYFFFYFIYFYINLVRQYRLVSNPDKKQIKYILIGFGVLNVIGPLAFLPAYGVPIYPIVFLAAIPYSLILAYTVVRYQMLNIKIIATEVLVAVMNLLVWAITLFPNLAVMNGKTFLTLLAVVVTLLSLIILKTLKKEIRHKEEHARLLALEESNRKLQELDRQKSEFLTMAAHQLRTPASIINNYVGVLQDGDYGRLSKDVKQILSNIDQSNQWLVRLADDFLNISKLEQNEVKFQLVLTDLAKIVDSVVAEMAPKAEAVGLKLVWNRPSEPAMVMADEEKIRVCIANLLDNAVKYGKIEGDEKIEEVTITVKEGKDNVGKKGVIFSVKDNGIGFDKDDEQRFFQKFSRGKNAKGMHVNLSTGLGLYIVKKFVEGHGGTVWAKSTGPGRGSEFGVWITGKKECRL